MAAGLGADVIGKLVCPIGVEGIESKWPAAIAVAVAAQLMQQISAVGAGQPEFLVHGRELLRSPRSEATRTESGRLEAVRPGEGAAAQALERLRSLRHYLPFFGKKRG